MAERLAQAGMQLAAERDLTSCAQRLVQIAHELELADKIAFVGQGDIDSIRAGDIDALPQRAFEQISCDRGGEPVVDVDGWSGVCVAGTSGDDSTWSGTLWAAGMFEGPQEILRTLAQQAGVAFSLVRELELQRTRQRHQRALVEAGKSLARHRDVDELLQHIVELATELVGARYGALGVVDESGTKLEQFLTVGIDAEQREKIGSLPTGKGILGVLINDPRPLRLANLGKDSRSVGFPQHHPEMTSFLGVPVTTRKHVKGRLYLAEKIGAAEFSEEDEELAISLASQAGIALENAGLYSALLQANTDLEEANQHKSAFLASMSHELRSPLNTIIGYTQLLLEVPEDLSDEQLEDVSIIQSSSKHLLTLISDLLDLSKIEAGKIVLRLEPVDGGQLLREAADAIRPQLNSGTELVVSDTSESVAMIADPSRVRQMLLNVMGNAAKFTTRGAITVSLVERDNCACFVVADNGPGIPEEDHARLFESFYQSTAALQRTPRTREGAGLGLAITQRLAHLHEGNVTLKSQVGEGTTVTICIPLGGPTASATSVREGA